MSYKSDYVPTILITYKEFVMAMTTKKTEKSKTSKTKSSKVPKIDNTLDLKLNLKKARAECKAKTAYEVRDFFLATKFTGWRISSKELENKFEVTYTKAKDMKVTVEIKPCVNCVRVTMYSVG